MTHPMIAPRGQHSPYSGKARAWFVWSVISPSIDCTTAALPEKKPAGKGS